MREFKEILEIRRRYASELLHKATVRGVGVGLKIIGGKITNEPCITVLVSNKIQPRDLSAKDFVPSEIEGVRTDVVGVGVVRIPRQIGVGRLGRIRPAPGGCSIGHVRVTAGTLGCLVERGGERFILSANHVLAATNFGVRGDVILQPGPADGGKVPTDELAELADYVPLDFTGINRMDAAIARPLSSDLVTPEIWDLGLPAGPGAVELGMRAIKSGRTTGITQGTVGVVEATIDVMYDARRVRFEGQCVIAEPGFSKGGDSGAAVVETATKRVVGLIFAGSEYATVFTPIGAILSAFAAGLCT